MRKTENQVGVAFFLYYIYASMGPVFIIAFISGSPDLLYWWITRFLMMLGKKLFKIVAVFLSLSTKLLSSILELYYFIRNNLVL